MSIRLSTGGLGAVSGRRRILTSLCAFFVHDTIAAFSAPDRISWSHLILMMALCMKKKWKWINNLSRFDIIRNKIEVYQVVYQVTMVENIVTTRGLVAQTYDREQLTATNVDHCRFQHRILWTWLGHFGHFQTNTSNSIFNLYFY